MQVLDDLNRGKYERTMLNTESAKGKSTVKFNILVSGGVRKDLYNTLLHMCV